MTREEVIAMAREAGIFVPIAETHALGAMTIKTLEDFAALVAAREREACAKVCEGVNYYDEDDPNSTFASAIRSRSTD